MSSLPDRPLLYAHRGAAAEQPENTIPSFARALELGADALEMDVHMSRDGHIVVSHDPSALRMTGVDVAFRDAVLGDIATWDAGHGFLDPAGERPFAGKGYRIPTLEQVLIEFPGVPLNIDLKQSGRAMITQALGLLRRTRSTSRVTVASFSTRTILAVRRAGYDGPTAVSRWEAVSLLLLPGRTWRRLWRRGGRIAVAAQLPTRLGPMHVNLRRLIDKCHGLGMRVDFWTINDADHARTLLALGADGIMTDDPAAVKPAFDQLDATAGQPSLAPGTPAIRS